MTAQVGMTPLSSRATAFSVAALTASDSGLQRQEAIGAKAPAQSAFHCPRSRVQVQHRSDGDVDVSIERQIVQLESGGVRVTLEEADLWRQFYALGTEMIVTKAGRRMFPVLKVNIAGLERQKTYSLVLDMELVENKRYKYAYHDSQWLIAGKADPPPVDPPSVYVHPESPARGLHWMKQTVVFDKVKLTNNETNPGGQLVLNSMHKYRPRIRIIPVQENETKDTNAVEITFPETEFIAVTAYQNQQITKLKIDSNPFAKGFRESRATARFAVDSCLKAFYEYKYSAEEATDDTLPPLALYRGSEATSPGPDPVIGHCQPLQQIKSGFIPVTSRGFGLQSPTNGITLDTLGYRGIGDSDGWRPTVQAPFVTHTGFFSPPCSCRPNAQLIPTSKSSYSIEEGRKGHYSSHAAPFLALACTPTHRLTPYRYFAGVHSVSRPYDRPTARRTKRANSTEDKQLDMGSS